MAHRLAVGAGELLLITVEWTQGIHRGTRNTLELDIRAYTHAEIQAIVDDTTSDSCRVATIDRYDIGSRIGEDITDAFDLERPQDHDEQCGETSLTRPLRSAFDRRQAARIKEMASR